MHKHEEHITCSICHKQFPGSETVAGELIRSGILQLIEQRIPTWSPTDAICLSCLNHFRTAYVEKILESEKGELTVLEQEVVESLRQQETLASDVNKEFDARLTFGERLSDRIADFGGSWRFIIIFAVVLSGWMLYNASTVNSAPFDPYPFILLNLVLSSLAAIQAPVIMMSQNRQEAKDRLRSENDYRVNLKAELEIRQLHAKIDQLLSHQWRRLMEVQQIQMEIMSDAREFRSKKS